MFASSCQYLGPVLARVVLGLQSFLEIGSPSDRDAQACLGLPLCSPVQIVEVRSTDSAVGTSAPCVDHDCGHGDGPNRSMSYDGCDGTTELNFDEWLRSYLMAHAARWTSKKVQGADA